MYSNLIIAVDMAHPEQIPHLVKAAVNLSSDITTPHYHVVYVDETHIHQAMYPQIDEAQYKEARKELKRKLKAEIATALPEGADFECHVRAGTAHEQILEESRQIKADAIVMMARRPGLASYFVGSNAERVVRHAKCTVLVLRGNY
jgi:nucleotide-binding universal stress UspA family protein